MAQSLHDIKHLLSTHGLHPKHRLGQNFLHDAHYLTQVVQAADIQPGELILEVGPGTGALSQLLLDAGALLVLVEIDHALEPLLQEQLAPYPNHWTLLIGDALAGKHALNPAIHQALQSIATAHAPPSTPLTFKLVANLPYQIASPLIANLLLDTQPPAMSSATVMVQREVADRLTAQPGSKQYGPLTILVHALAHVRRLFTVPPGAFWPMPKVDSALIRIDRRAQPLTDNPQALTRLVHKLFTQRRKQLGSILGRHTPWPTGIQPHLRPQQLSVPQLVALAQLIESPPPTT